MSTTHGNEGCVRIGANDIAEIDSFTHTVTGRNAEDSAMKDDAATFKTGKTEASGSISCHYDSTDSNGQTLLVANAEISLDLFPEGVGAGKIQITVPAIITSEGFNSEQEGIVSADFQYIRNGAETRTVQA